MEAIAIAFDPEAIIIFDEEQKEPRSIRDYEIILAQSCPLMQLIW